ncbi:MAG TPA: NIPSNAP family protein [Bradyrhizobium sp.]
MAFILWVALPAQITHPFKLLQDRSQCIGLIQQRSDLHAAVESLADREKRWTAFLNDPAWHAVRDESEGDGPIVATISNQLLTPTAFSALK